MDCPLGRSVWLSPSLHRLQPFLEGRVSHRKKWEMVEEAFPSSRVLWS